MTLLFNWRFWAVLAVSAGLAFSHFTVYRSGRASVRNEWNAEKLVQTQAAAAASEANRNAERALTKRNEGVDRAFQADKARRAAADRVISDRLRSFEAASDRAASFDTAPLGGAADPRPTIARECPAALRALERHVGQVESLATGLQGFAREVCVGEPAK